MAVKRWMNFSCQRGCNYLQRLFGRARAALSAIAAHFQAGNNNVEATVALDLTFKAVEEITLKFQDLPAAQARYVDVIALRAAFIEVLLSLHVHQIKLIHQSISFQQFECPVNSDAIDAGIYFAGMQQNLRRIEMLFRCLDHAQNRLALVGQAQTAGGECRLQPSRCFSLGKRHIYWLMTLCCSKLT